MNNLLISSNKKRFNYFARVYLIKQALEGEIDSIADGIPSIEEDARVGKRKFPTQESEHTKTEVEQKVAENLVQVKQEKHGEDNFNQNSTNEEMEEKKSKREEREEKEKRRERKKKEGKEEREEEVFVLEASSSKLEENDLEKEISEILSTSLEVETGDSTTNFSSGDMSNLLQEFNLDNI